MRYYALLHVCSTVHYYALQRSTTLYIFILLLIIISFTRGTNCTKNIYLLYTLYKAPQLDRKNIQVQQNSQDMYNPYC